MRGRSICAGLIVASGLVAAARAETPAGATNNSPSSTNAPAAQMHFRVIDADTGQPVQNVRVRNWAHDIPETDADGWCVFPMPHPKSGNFSYRITLTKEGYVPKFLAWSSAQKDKVEDIPSEYTVNMEKGVTIGGVVKNEKGEPLADVQVIFSGPPDAESGVREKNMVGRAYHGERTDENGRWHNAEVPRHFENFTFHVAPPDFLPVTFSTDAATEPDDNNVALPMKDYLATNAVMMLGHGIELSGIIVDASGKPVAGATVTRNHEWRNPSAVLETGEDGKFSIINLRPEDLILTVQANGLAGQTKLLTLTKGMPEVKIEMKPGHIFKGRVVDESGKPISSATVTMDRLDLGPLEYDWRTVTDDDGRFSWDSAPEDAHPYYFSAPSHHARSESGLVADGKDKVVTLRTATTGDKIWVDGTVIDATNGAPIQKFHLTVNELIHNAVTNITREVTATNGAYTAEIDSASDAYNLEIRVDGYLPARSFKKYTGDGDVSISFKLEKGTEATPPRMAAVGDTAPDFNVKTVDGKPLKLSDFRGKYVLLDFWATWCGPCVAEMPNMKATYDAYGKDPRFAMISLSIDDAVSSPQSFARKNNLGWIQGFLGSGFGSPVLKLYGIEGIPSIFLIGPDGKILANELRGEAIKDAIGRALGAQ